MGDLEPNVEPGGEDPIVVERVRAAVRGGAGSALVFGLAAPWLAPGTGWHFVSCAGAAVLLLVAALAWLRRAPTRHRATLLGEMACAIVITLSILGGMSLGGRFITPMIPVIVAMGTGSFVPWGVSPQLRVALVATAGVLLHLAWLGGTSSGYPPLVALLGIGLSVPMAGIVAHDRARLLSLAEKRRLADERFASLADNAPDPILTFDGEGRVRSANPATARLFGWSAADLLALQPFRFLRVVAPGSRAAVRGVAAELRTRGRAAPAEIEVVRSDGQRVLVEANQRLLPGASGDVEVQVILRDITERRRAEEAARLRELNAHMELVRERGRRQLAQRMHDELAQPLAALRLEMMWGTRHFAHLSGDDAALARKLAGLVESVIGAARSMIADLRPSVLDDFGLAEAVAWQARTFEEQHGVTCGTDLAGDHVDCDEERSVALFRSLQEILGAIARDPGLTRVQVALREDGDDVVLTVRAQDVRAAGSESGSGAEPAPAEIERIRERTRRLGGFVKHRSRGDGTVEIEARVRRDARAASLGAA